MRKVFLFMMITLDGYFEGENHDLSWHNVDTQFNNNFIIPQTKKVETMLFGRRTYEMMADFWLSEQARKSDPVTSELMDQAEKFVFSKTLMKADWKNTTLISDHAEEKVRKLKQKEGGLIAIFGSNTLLVSLAEADLVDECRIIVNPVVLGKGTPLFKGIKKEMKLKLLDSKTFKSGNALLTYQKIRE